MNRGFKCVGSRRQYRLPEEQDVAATGLVHLLFRTAQTVGLTQLQYDLTVSVDDSRDQIRFGAENVLDRIATESKRIGVSFSEHGDTTSWSFGEDERRHT